MRSRRDDVDLQATVERAKAQGLCGFGGAKNPPPAGLARRIVRSTEIDDGSFVWTRDADGLYWQTEQIWGRAIRLALWTCKSVSQ